MDFISLQTKWRKAALDASCHEAQSDASDSLSECYAAADAAAEYVLEQLLDERNALVRLETALRMIAPTGSSAHESIEALMSVCRAGDYPAMTVHYLRVLFRTEALKGTAYSLEPDTSSTALLLATYKRGAS